MNFPRLGVEARSRARIGDEVKLVAHQQRRGAEGCTAFRFPGDVGVRHVPFAVGLNRQQLGRVIPRAQEHQTVSIYGTGYHRVTAVAYTPDLFTGLEVVTVDNAASSADYLQVLIDLDDERRRDLACTP